MSTTAEEQALINEMLTSGLEEASIDDWEPGCRDLVRVGVNHPHVCKGTYNGKACTYHAYVTHSGEIGKYCVRHGAVLVKQDQIATRRNYRLTGLQDRVNELSDSPYFSSIREEVSLSRALMERLVNRYTDDNELEIHTPKLLKGLMEIANMAKTCQAIEIKAKYVIDRDTVLKLAEGILQAIGDEVKDPESLRRIHQRVYQMFQAHTEVVEQHPNDGKQGEIIAPKVVDPSAADDLGTYAALLAKHEEQERRELAELDHQHEITQQKLLDRAGG